MIPAERQIPFPLETAKREFATEQSEVPVRHAFVEVGKRYVLLLEASPLTAPGICYVRIGPGPDSVICNGLTIEQGQSLVALLVAQLLKGKKPSDALEMANLQLMSL